MSTKSSRLRFVSHHKHLVAVASSTDGQYEMPTRGHYYTSDMSTWRVEDDKGVELMAESTHIIRECAAALNSLHPFTSAMSLIVNLERRALIPAHRTWGLVYLDGVSILTFGPEKSGSGIYSLGEWPKPAHEYSQVLTWDAAKWRLFFLTQIDAAIREGLEITRHKKENVLRQSTLDESRLNKASGVLSAIR